MLRSIRGKNNLVLLKAFFLILFFSFFYVFNFVVLFHNQFDTLLVLKHKSGTCGPSCNWDMVTSIPNASFFPLFLCISVLSILFCLFLYFFLFSRYPNNNLIFAIRNRLELIRVHVFLFSFSLMYVILIFFFVSIPNDFYYNYVWQYESCGYNCYMDSSPLSINTGNVQFLVIISLIIAFVLSIIATLMINIYLSIKFYLFNSIVLLGTSVLLFLKLSNVKYMFEYFHQEWFYLMIFPLFLILILGNFLVSRLFLKTSNSFPTKQDPNIMYVISCIILNWPVLLSLILLP